MNRKSSWIQSLWMAAVGLILITSADGRNIAAWSITTNNAPSYATGIITTAGHTSVVLPSLAAINTVPDLNEVWLFNHSNNNYNGFGPTEQAAVDTFVQNGGNLVFFDRRVIEAASVLPGASGITFVRDISPNPNQSNPNLLNIGADVPAALVTGLNDASFDGGNFSSHGFALRSTIPSNGRTVLVRDENAEHSTGIVYGRRFGVVFYFPVPADFYLSGSGSATVRASITTLLTNFASGALVGSVPPIEYTLLRAKGGAVADAGVDPRIQAGALWTGFGNPAINESGSVAFVGKWKSPATKTPKVAAQSGVGIFLNDELIVKVGEVVPGAGTNGLPANAVFKSFKDPVVDDAGHVAFLAGIKGPGVSPANDTVVVSSGRTGSVEIIAREGDAAPGAGGATFKSFSSVSIEGLSIVALAVTPSSSGTLFTATLLPATGAPPVTTANDTGAWWLPAGGSAVELAVREGATLGSETIKSFVALTGLSGSPGHGRGLMTNGNVAILQLALTGGAAPRYAYGVAEAGGILTAHAITGDALGGTVLPDAVWAKINLPSFDANGGMAALGMLSTKFAGVKGPTAKGIFVSDDGFVWDPLVRTGDTAPGLPSGAVFSALKDPVHSSTTAGVAFIGGAKGGGIATTANDGIWYSATGDAPALLVREGDLPPGAPTGAQFKSFASLALPGGITGPLFTAMLVKGTATAPVPSGITSRDDFAFYGTNSRGGLSELFRENQPVLGKTLKSFNVLKSISGSAGVGRSFNANGQVVAYVSFTDGSFGHVLITIP